jgi:hypothetical protein
LPNFLSFHSGGNTGFTLAQSASSSSAIIAGSVVKVPCPISAAGETMVIVPSVAIVIQTFGDSALSASVAPEASPPKTARSGIAVSARVKPAAPIKSRRLRSVVRESMRSVMAQPSREARSIALMIFR